MLARFRVLKIHQSCCRCLFGTPVLSWNGSQGRGKENGRGYSGTRHDTHWNSGFRTFVIGTSALMAPAVLARIVRAKSQNDVEDADERAEDMKPGEVGRLNQRGKFNFISAVVDRVAPAVVYIEIKDPRRIDFRGVPQTVSNGSGFLVKENGLIVTNAHVVVGQPRSIVQVKLHDGRIFSGRVETIDMKSDLATVRIPCDKLPILNLGTSSTVKPGEWVVAVGSPLSLANTITAGVVSSVNRGSTELGLHGKDMEYIQTDAAITFGNSGGPLINLDGEVVGVNAMRVTSGISFAIPIDYVKEFLAEEKKEGWFESWLSQHKSKEGGKAPIRPRRRYMGVTLITLTPQLVLELQMRGNDLPPDVVNGVLIWKVVLGSPAHQGGLQPGDIIVAIDKNPIEHSEDVYRSLEGNGKQLDVTIVRKKHKMTLKINPEEV